MSDSPLPELSIVVPAYREASRLPETLRQLDVFAHACGFTVEVLVVVGRSPDATLKIAREFAATHPHFLAIDCEGDHGKGSVVRTGMLAARGRTVLFMDADLSVPLAEVPKFLAHFAAHPETHILIGDRQHDLSEIIERQSALREGMGQIFNRFVRWLAGLEWPDTQCGFKAFRANAAREIFRRQKLNGFAFDVEVLLLASRLGHRVESMPVVWINAVDSKVRIIADSARMLRDAFRVRRVVDATLREECEVRVSA